MLIALLAKNAILIVELGPRVLPARRRARHTSGDRGRRARFRPTVMTSFAFTLGAMPLVVASARKSNGMFASTCLALLFVPSFFFVV